MTSGFKFSAVLFAKLKYSKLKYSCMTVILSKCFKYVHINVIITFYFIINYNGYQDVRQFPTVRFQRIFLNHGRCMF